MQQRNVRFTEWFRFEPIAAHQKVVLAEDFMEYLAPVHWPPQDRDGFCWLPANSPENDCKMKEGVLVLYAIHVIGSLFCLSSKCYCDIPGTVFYSMYFSHCECFSIKLELCTF